MNTVVMLEVNEETWIWVQEIARRIYKRLDIPMISYDKLRNGFFRDFEAYSVITNETLTMVLLFDHKEKVFASGVAVRCPMDQHNLLIATRVALGRAIQNCIFNKI